jgi:hypothetical protein
MRLSAFSKILSGYQSRSAIEPREDGSHFLLQARDIDSHKLTCHTDTVVRFNPLVLRDDSLLRPGDIVFMARGAKNYTILLKEIPGPAVAAASFFMVRVQADEVLPAYVCWYLNQAPAEQYFRQQSGRGVHMPVVTRATLENIEVPLPALEVQERIAELDGLLRDEVALVQKLLEKRRQLATSVCLQAARQG